MAVPFHLIGVPMELEIHRLMKNIVYMNVLSWGVHVETEMQLKNKRIADIYFQWQGAEYIIEVKSLYKHSLIENAVEKYYGQSDFLVMAFPPDELPTGLQHGTGSWRTPLVDRVGLIEVGGGGIKLIRCPQSMRRKTVRQSPEAGGPPSH
jgi:hypothetical protein